MSKTKSSISKAESYAEIGEYWDTHDLDSVWDKTQPVEFAVSIQSEAIYYALEPGLSEQVRAVAKERGISPETLLNLWVQEKLRDLA